MRKLSRFVCPYYYSTCIRTKQMSLKCPRRSIQLRGIQDRRLSLDWSSVHCSYEQKEPLSQKLRIFHRVALHKSCCF